MAIIQLRRRNNIIFFRFLMKKPCEQVGLYMEIHGVTHGENIILTKTCIIFEMEKTNIFTVSIMRRKKP